MVQKGIKIALLGIQQQWFLLQGTEIQYVPFHQYDLGSFQKRVSTICSAGSFVRMMRFVGGSLGNDLKKESIQTWSQTHVILNSISGPQRLCTLCVCVCVCVKRVNNSYGQTVQFASASSCYSLLYFSWLLGPLNSFLFFLLQIYNQVSDSNKSQQCTNQNISCNTNKNQSEHSLDVQPWSTSQYSLQIWDCKSKSYMVSLVYGRSRPEYSSYSNVG